MDILKVLRNRISAFLHLSLFEGRKSRTRHWFSLMLVLVIILWSKVGLAHLVSMANIQGVVAGKVIHLKITLTNDKKLLNFEQIQDDLRNAITITNNQQPCRLDLKHVSGDVMTVMDTDIVCSEFVKYLKLHSEYKLDEKYKFVVSMTYQGTPTVVFLYSDSKDADFAFMGNGRKLQYLTWLKTIGQFITMGMGHIYTGYDHILFVLALILTSSQLRPLIKIVTAFTIAHSVTLILSTLDIVHVSSNIVEPMIAFSIAYVAFVDVISYYFKKNKPSTGIFSKLWFVAFGFGLFHGLGFSGALKDIKIEQSILIPALLSFNVGVELAQISIIATVLPILYYLKRYRYYPQLIHVFLSVIGLLGAFWFIQRIVQVMMGAPLS